MRSIYSINLLLFSILLNISALSGQNAITFDRMESLTMTSYYDTSGSGSSLLVNTHEYKELTTELSDTSNISSIRVKLGTTADASDIQSNTYNFSGEQLSSQLWLNRRVNILQMGLGDLVNREQCFIRIEALDAGGAVLGFYSGILY
ncbi:MAG TPA: hypothetical protein PL185_06435 [Flavobacteriales bacterium]|nr:hypothetical protein [Flavobacteriales bacterium]